MSLERRMLIAASLLFVDVIIFFIPMAAIFLGYIILFRPKWFQIWVNEKIYS